MSRFLDTSLAFNFLQINLVWLLWLPMAARSQEVKIWEFAAYEVSVWYAFDTSTNLSDAARADFAQKLEQSLQRTFRAAWNLELSELPPAWSPVVLDHFDEFSLDDLRRHELVTVVSATAEETRTVRTVEAALERLSQIAVTSEDYAVLQRSAERFGAEGDSSATEFLEKCGVVPASRVEIQQALLAAELPAAVLPRSQVVDLPEELRVLMTSLPWQTETLLRQRDKLLFLSISYIGDEFVFSARELDCPMQFLGPVCEARGADWQLASRLAAEALIRSFAPVARVENAEAYTAELQQRAGGLIVDPHNPARINVGDVLQPIVRRDDRNGVAALLQPLSWTYAAVTEAREDGVRLDANVYSYSGGPGLRGRQNRRTQRVLLRVRPQTSHTDIRLLARDSQSPLAGCFVYQRDLLTDEFQLLGRTDWRGQFRIAVPEHPGRFLPDAIRRERFIAKREALQRAAAEAANKADQQAPSEQEQNGQEKQTPEQTELMAEVQQPQEMVGGSDAEVPLAEDPQSLPLNFPLLEIYLKNGETVLAKLPLVPGLQPVEVAELPDDNRRLRAEGFVSGFQGEILDLVGMRNLLAARITLLLKDSDVSKANEVLEQLRQLPTYTELSDRLEAIQRQMLDEQAGNIPLAAKNRIDRMFQTTRNLLQKYLQDDLVQRTESSVRRSTGPTSGGT